MDEISKHQERFTCQTLLFKFGNRMNCGCNGITNRDALVSQVQMHLYHRLFDFMHWKMELLDFDKTVVEQCP